MGIWPSRIAADDEVPGCLAMKQIRYCAIGGLLIACLFFSLSCLASSPYGGGSSSPSSQKEETPKQDTRRVLFMWAHLILPGTVHISKVLGRWEELCEKYGNGSAQFKHMRVFTFIDGISIPTVVTHCILPFT